MNTSLHRRALLLPLIGALALVALGCARQSLTAPAASVTATPSPTVPALPAATATPSPTIPALPAATATPQPSPTAAASSTPLAMATPQRASAGQAPLPNLAGLQVVTTTNTSPDAQWSATSFVATPRSAPDNYYTRLLVTRADAKVAWTLVDQWSRWGMGYTTPDVLQWSRDGASLYFTNKAYPDGCAPFVNATDLYRADLSTGTITQIVPPVGLWLALSPDETKLAYAGFRERGLVVRDLSTGREQETGLKPRPGSDVGDAIGLILWSADGSSVVYTVAVRPCSGSFSESQSVWAEATSIVRVDAATLNQTTLLSDDKQLRIASAWAGADMLLVRGKDGQKWLLNVTTGRLEKG